MAHEVRVKFDTAVALNKDIEIIVKADDERIGTLLVSKGNIEWLPKGNSVNKLRFTWKKFAEFMKAHGTPAK